MIRFAKVPLLRTFGALGLLAAFAGAHAERVVRVIDGDSIIIDSGGNEVNVRLAGIDAPELAQPYGEEAKDALAALVNARDVHLELISGDAYRRIIAHVSVDGRDVAGELVVQGFAWVRRAYNPTPELIRLEVSSRSAGRGLWSDAKPIPPWIWRKSRKKPTSAESLQTPARTVVECGKKNRCSQMSSCEEAIAYLHRCALQNIDGDNDGIPCESLCKYYR